MPTIHPAHRYTARLATSIALAFASVSAGPWHTQADMTPCERLGSEPAVFVGEIGEPTRHSIRPAPDLHPIEITALPVKVERSFRGVTANAVVYLYPLDASAAPKAGGRYLRLRVVQLRRTQGRGHAGDGQAGRRGSRRPGVPGVCRFVLRRPAASQVCSSRAAHSTSRIVNRSLASRFGSDRVIPLSKRYPTTTAATPFSFPKVSSGSNHCCPITWWDVRQCRDQNRRVHITHCRRSVQRTNPRTRAST